MTLDSGSVCLVAQIRNEEVAIEEWLNHHFQLGFAHAFLMLDRCTDSTEQVLQPYVEKGLVTIEQINLVEVGKSTTGDPLNYPFNKAMQKLRGLYHWAAFFDCDEFLNPSGTESLQQILEDLEWAGGVAVMWRFFHSNFHALAEDGDRHLRANYVLRAKDEEFNQGFKTIVNLERFQGSFPFNPHLPDADEGTAPVVHTDGEVFKTIMVKYRCRYDRLVLHHYYSKSWEFWAKTKVGRSSFENPVYGAKTWFENMGPGVHTVFDDSLRRFAGEEYKRQLQVLPKGHFKDWSTRMLEWADKGFPKEDLVAVDAPQSPEAFAQLWQEWMIPEELHFDPMIYKALNPDIGDFNPLDHFVLHGFKEHRMFKGPMPEDNFDSEWYLEHHQDVKAAGMHPWVHYIRHGKFEGRASGPNMCADSCPGGSQCRAQAGSQP